MKYVKLDHLETKKFQSVFIVKRLKDINFMQKMIKSVAKLAFKDRDLRYFYKEYIKIKYKFL